MVQRNNIAAVFHFAFRWSRRGNEAKEWLDLDDDKNTVIRVLKTKADAWIFQAEDPGWDLMDKEIYQPNLHFQGYLHVKTRIRPKQLAAELSLRGLKGVWVGPSSTAGLAALKNYCLKDEGRMAGPWADRVPKTKYTGQDLWPEEKWPSWQKELKRVLDGPAPDRQIRWIYDEDGGQGKSKFCKWMALHRAAWARGYDTAPNLSFMICKDGPQKIVLIDLPRQRPGQIPKGDLYSALEMIKDGKVNSAKYEGKELLFEPPHVVVFANHYPETDRLSKGRFITQTITDGKLCEIQRD